MPSGRLRSPLCPVGRIVPTPPGPHRREEVRLLGLRPTVRPVRPPVEARDAPREARPQGEEEDATAAAGHRSTAADEARAISRILRCSKTKPRYNSRI